MFAVVDLSGLSDLLQPLVNLLAGIDPTWAGFGAIALLVIQRLGGHKVDLWGLVKSVVAKFAPTNPNDPTAVPADLSDAEKQVLAEVLKRIKDARASTAEVAHTSKVQDLLKRIFGDESAPK